MILAFIVVFLAGYIAVMGWAARRGRGAVLAAAGATLGLVVLAALLLGQRYAVPSIPRLLLFALAFLGPAVVLPPLLLWRPAATGGPALSLALLGAVAGLLGGWVLVVFGLRVW